MNELTFNLINNENNIFSNNEILLENAFSCKLYLQILINNELTNSFETIYDEDNSWIIIKKNFIKNNDKNTSNFIIYIDDNYTNKERYYYLSVRNNLDNSISTLIIKQPACNFKIELYPNEINFNKDNIEQEINVKIYGAEKIGLINSDYIDIKIGDDIIDYDNSLYFNIKNKKDYYEYEEYTLSLKFLGDFNNIKDYFYEFPIIHKNNIETKQILKINVSNITETNIDELLNDVDSVFNEQNKDNELTIKNRNKNNLGNKIKKLSNTNVQVRKSKNNLKKLETITNVSILNNQITLQTNSYNYEGVIEHNSMIFVQSRALWCHISNNYDKKNNLHYINVSCDNNFWGVERKTFVIIRNAEDSNYYNKKVFIIKQDINDNIIIEEKKG